MYKNVRSTTKFSPFIVTILGSFSNAGTYDGITLVMSGEFSSLREITLENATLLSLVISTIFNGIVDIYSIILGL